jgi:hypothetical protein
MLAQGDLIFHPRHGFGTISGLTRRDPLHPIQDVVAAKVCLTRHRPTTTSSSWMAGRCLRR